jgi:hypothetical protein
MSSQDSRYPPFTAQNALSTERLTTRVAIEARPPSSEKSKDNPPIDYIPGAPNINLSQSAVNSFLTEELSTPLLNELYDHLWFVARKQGNYIDPLHRQKIKGRQIIPAEEARLHLVWQEDKVYVKPIPQCLLNYDFWTTYLPPPGSTYTSTTISNDKLDTASPLFDRSVALGFLRSYAFLICHQSDFKLAQEAHLIPVECNWIQWARFATQLYRIPDRDVARRYHYGQIRLQRLHWCVRIFRPKTAQTHWWYEIPLWTIRMYIAYALTPLVFAFASVSVVLSSMQVMLAVPDNSLWWKRDGVALVAEYRAFWIFSFSMLLFTGVTWLLIAVIVPFLVFFWQVQWGYRHRFGVTKENVTV